jgi:protein-tyrosine-phosphatase
MANRFVVEGFFEGFGLGLSVLAKDGRILQAFQHERVHQTDLTSGSSYRRAIPVSPDLEDAAERILQPLRYTGLAMLEFRRNRSSGEYILLEVNARPWGSLPFPIALGVDFPFLWYRLLTQEIESLRVSYREGIYSRNMEHDLIYLRSRVEQLKDKPLKAIIFSMTWLSGFWRWAVGRECWDSLVLDDPRPGLVELKREIQRLVRLAVRPVWVLAERVLQRLRAKRVLAKAYESGGDGVIVFVCQGNICRSPFAALQLERFLGARIKKPKIMSAGILPLEGRSPPRIATLAARERGVNMTTHKSRHLSRALAESASVIIVFDHLNRRAVTARYPDLKTVVGVGDLSPGDEFDAIRDPYGKDAATFRATYAAVTDCNRAIALALSLPTQSTQRIPLGREGLLRMAKPIYIERLFNQLSRSRPVKMALGLLLGK